MTSLRRAALFDMDRTLVAVNTGHLYIRWRFARREAGLSQLLRVTGWMVRYSVGMLDAAQVSELALRTVEGQREDRMREDCRAWYESAVRKHVTTVGRREVESRRADGWVCAILSASTEYATGPLADDLGIEHVLCNRLDVQDGRFTGAIQPPLCYGHGKVEVAERWARDHDVDLDASVFFTDSISDLPMLERVGEPRVVNPDPRLRVIARQRGWHVERWR